MEKAERLAQRCYRICRKGARYSAFTLWEVLLASSLVAMILLGLMALHVEASRVNWQSYYRSVAVLQAESMLQRLRADTTPGSRTQAYVAWNEWNQRLLPNGHGRYDCYPLTQRCTVSLTWQAAGRQAYALSGRAPADRRVM